MNKKSRGRLSAPWISAIVAALLVAVIFLIFLLPSGPFGKRGTGIVLPEGIENTPEAASSSRLLTIQSVADVNINTANAKNIIASLVRPEAYSCKIENKLYYTGGYSTLYCTQYINDAAERVDTTDALGMVQSTILKLKDKIYSWDAGSTKAYEGSWGDFTGDDAAMLPTYEDVLKDDVALTEAERKDLGQEPCMQVTFDSSGYNCEYYISLSTGLLKSVTYRKDGAVTREVYVKSLELKAPDEKLFEPLSG